MQVESSISAGVKRQRRGGDDTASVWTKKIAKEGDLILLQRGHKESLFLVLKANEQFQHAFGMFKHDSIIGKPYGSRIYPDSRAGDSSKKIRKASAPRGELQLLSVTPELWTRTLDHRTQILYAPDCALIAAQLHLRPGMKVAETGTGSGSLSTSMARILGSKGSLHTFEFNEVRSKAARKDFEMLGLHDVITVHHRDSCKEGFMDHGDDDRPFDAVFLDLPQPWLAVPHAKRALKPFGRICSFSPCIEQVQRTSVAMSTLGFTEIRTFTGLAREIRSYVLDAPVEIGVTVDDPKPEEEGEGKPFPMIKRLRYETRTQETKFSEPYTAMAGHTGYLTFAYRSVN